MSLTKRFAAAGSIAILTVGAAVVTAAPADAASKGTCSVSVNVWTNDWDEIISDATAVCNQAKSVKVRSRLYYCNWVAGGSRSYVLKKTKTVGTYSSLNGRKKVTVVDKAMFGKWYAEGYVWYKRGKTSYAKSDLDFASVGSRPTNADC